MYDPVHRYTRRSTEELGMAYQSQHIHYVFSGGLPGGEIWNTGLRTTTATADESDLAALAQAAGLAFRARIFNSSAGLSPYISPAVTFLACRTYLQPTTGPAPIVADWENPQNTHGLAAAQTAPNQTALVISTRTNRAGRSARGRMYLPCDAPVMSTDNGRCSTEMTNAVGLAGSELITDLNALTGDTNPGPWPIAIQSQVAAGTPPVVTFVAIGDVLDTQRRRRDKLIENYLSFAVT
jgi:hypothetical protein